MSDRVDRNELINRIAQHTGEEPAVVATVMDATFEEIYTALKHEESVTIRNFGTFYIDVRRGGTVFKFNPAQRLRALFGWSSTYRGEL